MKNKSKKILAGIGLGVMSALSLTGCSMSDEQQEALDKVVSKADQIIELVEQGNKKLDREGAVLLYKHALTRLQLNKDNVWDNLIVDASYGNSSDQTAHYITHFYKLANGKNILYSIDNNEVCNYMDNTLEATSGNGSFEYYAYSLAVGTGDGITIDVTIDNLVNCVVLENGNYLLTCVEKGAFLGYDDAECIFECEISEEGVIYGMTYQLLEKNGVQGSLYKMDYSFTNVNIAYKYGELTETMVQGNIDTYNS